MSTEQQTSSTQQIHFAPLYRTAELENIHAQVTQNDSQQQQPTSSTRKVLSRHMTVIGDGSDKDSCKITTQ